MLFGYAGGLMVTAPSEKDLRDSVLGEYINKYLQGVNGVNYDKEN